MQIERKLLLNIPGATQAEIERGLAAAQAVLNQGGVTPYEAAAGYFARDGWDVSGFSEDAVPTDAQLRAAGLWEDADVAAVEACCAEWPQKPEHAGLELQISEKDSWTTRCSTRLIQLYIRGLPIGGDWNDIAPALWEMHGHLSPEESAEAYVRDARGQG